jgi:hypothetical protein
MRASRTRHTIPRSRRHVSSRLIFDSCSWEMPPYAARRVALTVCNNSKIRMRNEGPGGAYPRGKRGLSVQDRHVGQSPLGPVLVPPATPEPQPEPFKLQAVGDPSACGVRNRADALCNVDRKADANYSAHVPDVPGCVATGDTVACNSAASRLISAPVVRWPFLLVLLSSTKTSFC